MGNNGRVHKVQLVAESVWQALEEADAAAPRDHTTTLTDIVWWLVYFVGVMLAVTGAVWVLVQVGKVVVHLVGG